MLEQPLESWVVARVDVVDKVTECEGFLANDGDRLVLVLWISPYDEVRLLTDRQLIVPVGDWFGGRAGLLGGRRKRQAKGEAGDGEVAGQHEHRTAIAGGSESVTPISAPVSITGVLAGIGPVCGQRSDYGGLWIALGQMWAWLRAALYDPSGCGVFR